MLVLSHQVPDTITEAPAEEAAAPLTEATEVKASFSSESP